MREAIFLIVVTFGLALIACGGDAEQEVGEIATAVVASGTNTPIADGEATNPASPSATASPVPVTTDVTATNPPATPTSLPIGTNQATAPSVEEETPTSVVVTPTQTSTIESTPGPVGSAERPIQLWSAPSAGADIGGTRAEIISETLASLTDYTLILHFPESDEAAAEALCDDPAATMAILPAEDYAEAAKRCGARAGLTALHFGEPWHLGMIVVRSDSGIEALADLAGARGAVPSMEDMATWGAFEAALAEVGVEPGELVELGSDTETMLAVFQGEVDFATASFIPPILPNEARTWVYGQDDPEIWRVLAGFMPERAPEGYIIIGGRPDAGGYRIRDARAAVYDVAPEIFLQTRILTLSVPIPNDTIAFAPDFPTDVADAVTGALADYANSDACATTLCSRDFYNWEGLVVAGEELYSVFGSR